MSHEQSVELKQRIQELLTAEPDVAHGLMALYEETEDYTCLTLKSILGKREKGKAERVF